MLISDRESNRIGGPPFGAAGEDDIGNLWSAFLDVQLKKINLAFSLQASMLDAGDYWVKGNTAEWLRFETVYTF